MFSFGYRDRKWRIFKDVCFIIIACVLIARAGVWGVILGALALAWYGRDLYYQLRAVKLEKEASRSSKASQGQSTEADGKITVTDLSDAKEVNYEKE